MEKNSTFLTYKVIVGVLITIFLSITGYFFSFTVTKLTDIQKELTTIQIQIAEMKVNSEKNFILLSGQILSKEEIREIVIEEITKHILKDHVNK